MQVFTESHKKNYQYHQWLSLRRTPLLLTEFISSRFEHCSCCCSVGGIALPSSLACSRIRFLQKVRFVLTQVTNWLYKNPRIFSVSLKGTGSLFSIGFNSHSLIHSLTLVHLLNQSNQSISQSIHLLTSQLVSQSIDTQCNQTTNKPSKQTISQSISRLTNQPATHCKPLMTRPKYNQPTNQYSEGQSINQLTDESNQWKKQTTSQATLTNS